MRKFFLLALAFIVISTSYAQQKNPDSLIYKAFNAIRTQDENAFLVLFPDSRQMKTIFDDFINDIKDSAKKQAALEEFGNMSDSAWKQMLHEKMGRSFRKKLEELNENKIKPGALVFKDAKYQETKIDAEHQYKTIEGTIYLKNGTEDLELSFSEVIWLEKEQGWFGIVFKRLRRKGEIDAFDMMPTDSAVAVPDEISIDTAPPPPVEAPPLPPKKTAGKTPTKSQARKPKT